MIIRDRMNIHFSLPQLRDLSYISVVNRSVHLNQSVKDRSLSPNASLAKNASISYDHVKTSSPVKGESKAPQFSPPLEQNARDNSILQGANHEVRIDARANSSISSPQIKQLEWQNDGVNGRHSSGISSPMQNLSKQVNSPNKGQPGIFKSPNLGEPSNSKFPDMANPSNFKFPDMGNPSNFESPNKGHPSNSKSPGMGEMSSHCAPHMGEQGNFQVPKMGNKKGIAMYF